MYVKIKKKRMKNLEKLYKYFFFIALTMIRIKKKHDPVWLTLDNFWITHTGTGTFEVNISRF